MLHAVVMAGGSGTRFWPKSRRNRPKQLLKLTGDATMLQQTVARIAPMAPPGRVWIVTGADQADAVRAQLSDLPRENVVAEPCPRDTAACVGLAAQVVAKLGEEWGVEGQQLADGAHALGLLGELLAQLRPVQALAVERVGFKQTQARG